MNVKKPNRFLYSVIRFLSRFPRGFLFKNKILRNEIKGKKGPMVVLANHQAALDFVNLIVANSEPMHFVISSSFYKTLPCPAVVENIGLIPKQQFQTSLRDITTMRSVVDHDGILVLYPAGLMCEDGLSTPIPATTYKFLQWIKADVYVARSEGTYFCTPKWATGRKNRGGRTYMDIYRLFTKDELLEATEEQIKAKVDEALMFDAYREQEKRLVPYRHCSDLRGLENVLYMCPNCKSRHTVRVRDKSVIYCESCSYTERADKYGFLHLEGEIGDEIRYVSDWNTVILNEERARLRDTGDSVMTVEADVHTVPEGKRRYEKAGRCTITLQKCKFVVTGTLLGEEKSYEIPSATFSSLPFKPGKCFDLQHGDESLRCYPDNPETVMEFVNRVKLCHEMSTEECECSECKA